MRWFYSSFLLVCFASASCAPAHIDAYTPKKRSTLPCGNLPVAFYVAGISQSRFTLCNLPVAFPVRHPTILWLKCMERSWAIAKGLARSFLEAYQREMPDKCCQHRVDPVQESDPYSAN